MHMWPQWGTMSILWLCFFILVFQSFAEFKMLNMSIKVSFGWMLGSSKNMIDGTLLRQIKYSVGIVAILEVHIEMYIE